MASADEEATYVVKEAIQKYAGHPDENFESFKFRLDNRLAKIGIRGVASLESIQVGDTAAQKKKKEEAFVAIAGLLKANSPAEQQGIRFSVDRDPKKLWEGLDEEFGFGSPAQCEITRKNLTDFTWQQVGGNVTGLRNHLQKYQTL